MSEPSGTATPTPASGIKQEITEHKAAEAAACCEAKVEMEQPECKAGAIEIESNLAIRIKQEEECLIDCSEDEVVSENADDDQAYYDIYDVYELDAEQEEQEHGPSNHRSSVNITEDKELASFADSEMLSSGSESDDYPIEKSSDDEYTPGPRKGALTRKGKQQFQNPKRIVAAATRGRKRRIGSVRDKREKRKRLSAEFQHFVMQKMNEIAEVAEIYRNPNRPSPAVVAHARSKHASTSLAKQSQVQNDAFLRANFLVWLCPVCDTEYQSKHKWRQHLDAMHQMLERETLNMEYLPNSRARCRQCNKEMTSIFWTVLMHEVTHLPHSDFLMCKLCNWRIGSMRGALLHLRQQHADETAEPEDDVASVSGKLETDVYICPFCQQTFAEQTLMMVHIKRVHKSANAAKAVYLCPDCGQRFRAKLRFHKHLVDAHNYDSAEKLRCVELEVARSSAVSRAFKCLECAAIEPNPAPVKMREHALLHSGAKCFQCVYCERSFESSRELRVHFCVELRQKFLAPAGFDSGDNKGKHKKPRFIQYVCPMCGEETDSKTRRAEHEESEHNMGTPAGLNFALVEGGSGGGDSESGAIYKCTVCEKKMALNVAVMYTHAVIHMPHNRWKCGRCDTPFRRLQHTYLHDCSVSLKRPAKKSKYVYLNKFEYMVSHVCPVCNADFTHRRQWWRHLRQNHALATFADMRMEAVDKCYMRCLDCNVLVRSRYTNRLEHRFQHLAYKPYRCKGCAETFDTLNATSLHVAVCSKGVGIIKGGNSDGSLLEGLPVRANDQPPPPAHIEHKFVKITCPICTDVAFTTTLEQLAHFRNVHNHFSDKYTVHSNGSMNCQVCGKYFQDSDKVVMAKHQRTHIVKNCFHCLQCDFTAHTLNKLRGHITISHGDELNRLEASAVELAETVDPLETADDDIAQISKTRIAVKAANAPVYSQFAEYISYACPECNEPLPTESDWHAHINSLHSFFNEEEMHLQFMVDGSLMCTDCGVKVSHANFHQQRHKLTHMPYKSFICTLCTHRSNTIGVLIQHLRRRHFTPGQYKCEVCSQVFGTSYERYKHIKEHDPADWPPCMCRICYAVLRTKSALLTHLDTHDPNRQMFPCAACNCEYKNVRELQRHLRACHPDELNPFTKTEVQKCAVCEENCESVEALIAHMQSHDAAEIPDTVCPVCGKTFKTARSCAVHKRSIHKPSPIATGNSDVNVNESTGRKHNRQKKPTPKKTNEKGAKPGSSVECRDEDLEDVEMIVPDDN